MPVAAVGAAVALAVVVGVAAAPCVGSTIDCGIKRAVTVAPAPKPAVGTLSEGGKSDKIFGRSLPRESNTP